MDLKHIQNEIDTAFLYDLLGKNEEDPHIKGVLMEMADIQNNHAKTFLKKAGLSPEQMPKPSTRIRRFEKIGKIMGWDFVLGVLLDTEKKMSKNKFQNSITFGTEGTSHITILKTLLMNNGNISGSNLARFEKKHRSVGGNALRAAVLGGNDGLVSNFSLVMGIAGATSGQNEILLAGLAGLLAGALSMALGEWISVKSSQELYENQMAIEKEEIETNPEGEEKELALIYRAKGIEKSQAEALAKEVMKDKEKVHQIMIAEELGINQEELKGSAMEAAVTSFVLFALGAIIPVFPFFFMSGMQAVIVSTILSAIGLFGIGSAITLFTGRSIWFSGIRQVLFGLAAAAITFGIGKLIGVNVVG